MVFAGVRCGPGSDLNQARSQRFDSTKSSSQRVSSNQAWVGNGGQSGISTMRDIQGCGREANHKIKTRNQKQGAGKNRGRVKTKGSRQSETLR